MAEKTTRSLARNKHFSDTPIPWLLPLVLVLGFMFIYPTFEVLRYGFTDARDRKSTRLNSSHSQQSRMPSSA